MGDFMVYCTSCGAENKEDSLFCKKCGVELKKEKTVSSKKKTDKSLEEKIEEQAEKIGEAAEKAADEVSKAATRFGTHFERRMDRFGKHIETWPERTFGIAGPLISAFIGLIILWIVSYFFQQGGEQFPTLVAIGEIFYNNLLFIFGLFLLGNYNSYVYRKYKAEYRWITPAVSTLVFIGWLWIIAKILLALSEGLDIGFFGSLAQFIDTFLIAIFVVVLLFSYGVMVVFFYTDTSE